jgi:hypothetical protein
MGVNRRGDCRRFISRSEIISSLRLLAQKKNGKGFLTLYPNNQKKDRRMLVSPFLMKVFARLFQKAAGSWGSAPSRARRREILYTAFLVLFAPEVSKRTERVFSHNLSSGINEIRSAERMKSTCVDEIAAR